MKALYKNPNNRRWLFIFAGLAFFGTPIAKAQQGIVGGENTTIEENPWQVWLNGCGGSVISEDWIITAAHCSPKTGRTVTLGQTNRSQGGSQTRTIAQAIIHPNYSDVSRGYDIALIKVSQPIDLSDPKVGAIKIVTQKDADAGLTKPGVMATTSGWGATSEGGSLAQILQKVDVPINTDAEASRAYGNQYKAEHMISAGYIGQGGKDACQGDSGGPFIVPDGDGGEYKLAGIVSWGDGCARRDKPGIYTRLSTYADWVFDQTGIDPNDQIKIDPSASDLKGFEDSVCGAEELGLTFTLTNNGANELTQATIKYTINTDEKTENWSGNLTTGQFAEVTLPKTEIVDGRNTVKIVVELNGDEVEDNNTLEGEFEAFIPAIESAQGDSVCGTGMVELMAEGKLSGTIQWFESKTSTDVLHEGEKYMIKISKTQEFFAAEIIELNGIACESDRVPIKATSKDCLGINLLHNIASVNFYPNPATNKVLVTGKSFRSNTASLKIINLQGQIVYSENISTTKGAFQKEINLELRKGMYFLQIKTEKNLLNNTLVIE